MNSASAHPPLDARERFATHPLQLALGLAIWLGWFALAYGGLSIGCAIAPPPAEAGPWTWINAAVGAFTFVTIVVLAVCTRLCWRTAKTLGDRVEPRRRFIPVLGAAIHLTALICTAFVGITLAILPPCV